MVEGCSRWHNMLKKQLNLGEEKIQNLAEEKRARRKARTCGNNSTTSHICIQCSGNSPSHTGLTRCS